MAQSYVINPGDGVQTDWPVPFKKLDPDHVKVFVDGAETAFLWVGDGIVRVTPAAPLGSAVLVKRVTPDDPLTVFSNTKNLTADNLNVAEVQPLFVAVEARDGAADAVATAGTALRKSAEAAETADRAEAKADAAVSTANSADTTATIAAASAAQASQEAADAAALAEAAQAAAQAAADSASVHIAADLPYDNAASRLAATDVQHAIDLIAGATGLAQLTSDDIVNESGVNGDTVSAALAALGAEKAGVTAVNSAFEGVNTTLLGKAEASHTHTMTQITDLGPAAAKDIATAAAIRANSGTDAITTDQAWAAAGWADLGNISGDITIDCSLGQNFFGTLVGNVTISTDNAKPGQPLFVALKQDATGGRTVSWNGSQFLFPNSTAPSVGTAANNFAVLLSAVANHAGPWWAIGWKL